MHLECPAPDGRRCAGSISLSPRAACDRHPLSSPSLPGTVRTPPSAHFLSGNIARLQREKFDLIFSYTQAVAGGICGFMSSDPPPPIRSASNESLSRRHKTSPFRWGQELAVLPSTAGHHGVWLGGLPWEAAVPLCPRLSPWFSRSHADAGEAGCLGIFRFLEVPFPPSWPAQQLPSPSPPFLAPTLSFCADLVLV